MTAFEKQEFAVRIRELLDELDSLRGRKVGKRDDYRDRIARPRDALDDLHDDIVEVVVDCGVERWRLS